MDVTISSIFKIESCFPSEIDSKPFHSPFVEKGMALCKIKIENTRKHLSSTLSIGKKKKDYTRVVDIDM